MTDYDVIRRDVYKPCRACGDTRVGMSLTPGYEAVFTGCRR